MIIAPDKLAYISVGLLISTVVLSLIVICYALVLHRLRTDVRLMREITNTSNSGLRSLLYKLKEETQADITKLTQSVKECSQSIATTTRDVE